MQFFVKIFRWEGEVYTPPCFHSLREEGCHKTFSFYIGLLDRLGQFHMFPESAIFFLAAIHIGSRLRGGGYPPSKIGRKSIKNLQKKFKITSKNLYF